MSPDPVKPDASSVAADATAVSAKATGVAAEATKVAASAAAVAAVPPQPIQAISEEERREDRQDERDRITAAADLIEKKAVRDDTTKKSERDASALLATRNFRLTVIGLFLAAIPGGIAAWRAGTIQKKVDGYHEEVNHMKDELVDTVRKASHAEGVIEGKTMKTSK